jgi:hypothetical protein
MYYSGVGGYAVQGVVDILNHRAGHDDSSDEQAVLNPGQTRDDAVVWTYYADGLSPLYESHQTF